MGIKNVGKADTPFQKGQRESREGGHTIQEGLQWVKTIGEVDALLKEKYNGVKTLGKATHHPTRAGEGGGTTNERYATGSDCRDGGRTIQEGAQWESNKILGEADTPSKKGYNASQDLRNHEGYTIQVKTFGDTIQEGAQWESRSLGRQAHQKEGAQWESNKILGKAEAPSKKGSIKTLRKADALSNTEADTLRLH